MSRYRTIVADPPWPMKGGPGIGAGESEWFANQASRDLPYATLSIDAISSLPVQGIAAPDAHLYLWAPNRFLEDAYDVARAWGFKPSTVLVWAKATMGGGLGGTYGISTEFVLFCRRGKLGALDREPRTWFQWKRPYDERGKPKHSAKPPELLLLAERISPAPRIELFARQRTRDWHAWGDQIDSDVEMVA